MFRGLISIDDDYSLLFKRNAVPGNAPSLVNRDRRLRVPEQEIYRPHRRFLEYIGSIRGCWSRGVHRVPDRDPERESTRCWCVADAVLKSLTELNRASGSGSPDHPQTWRIWRCFAIAAAPPAVMSFVSS